ncbi:MAG: hypothetical protein JXA25_17915 [Anaerolineales bacterium]|nr:hypothetical protein [Anaerolineales bacterium]
MRIKTGLLILAGLILLLACSSVEALLAPLQAPAQAPVKTPILATEAGSLPGLEPAAQDSALPAGNEQTAPGAAAQEAILILEPGPGSRVLSPLHVTGWADPTFEQTLLARVLRTDGSLLIDQPIQIAADMGQRGPFGADLPFSVTEAENVLVQILDISARDGGVVHLASVGVTLLPGGDEVLSQAGLAEERLQIFRPAPGETIRGGRVLVEGYGLASFENSLVVEVYDAGGARVGFTPCMTSAQEPGEMGTFSVEVEYNVSLEGPGRVSVVDTLPVFDGVGHVTSVVVTLAP